MDSGTAQADALAVSKDINSYVADENVNGLEQRLQSTLFLKRYVLEDMSLGTTAAMSFVWRRNSAQEPVLDAQNHPVMTTGPHAHPKMKFYTTTQNLSANLESQRT